MISRTFQRLLKKGLHLQRVLVFARKKSFDLVFPKTIRITYFFVMDGEVWLMNIYNLWNSNEYSSLKNRIKDG